MKSKVLILIIVTVLLISLLLCLTYKPDIHTATYDELIEIHGIGEVLGERVSQFLLENPDAKLADLDQVKGIGEGKIKLLAKKWSEK